MIYPDLGYNKATEGFTIFRSLKQSIRENKGYTLTEIVLVLGLLGIIISGVLPVFLNSITANKSAEYYSMSYKILDSKIEEYRNADFNALADSTFTVSELPSGQGVLVVTNNIEGAPQADIKKIDLIIQWNFKNQRQVRAVTYISRGGIKK